MINELTENEEYRIRKLALAFAISDGKNFKKDVFIPLNDPRMEALSKFKTYTFKFNVVARQIDTKFATLTEESKNRLINDLRKCLLNVEKFYKNYKNILDLSDLRDIIFPLSNKQTFYIL